MFRCFSKRLRDVYHSWIEPLSIGHCEEICKALVTPCSFCFVNNDASFRFVSFPDSEACDEASKYFSPFSNANSFVSNSKSYYV